MIRLNLIAVVLLLLTACGAPVKPEIDHTSLLISALVAQDSTQINLHDRHVNINVKNRNIISLYMSVINNQPYQLISNSQQLIKNFHHYNQNQQSLLKPMLIWAYLHPIYRQETAKQVRLLQREELLVAPSNIEFNTCETGIKGCANLLRQQIAGIASPKELTEALTQMATNDPCINLSEVNLGGDFGNQCLASRKGNLKVNLISPPIYLSSQWDAVLNP